MAGRAKPVMYLYGLYFYGDAAAAAAAAAAADDDDDDCCCCCYRHRLERQSLWDGDQDDSVTHEC